MLTFLLAAQLASVAAQQAPAPPRPPGVAVRMTMFDAAGRTPAISSYSPGGDFTAYPGGRRLLCQFVWPLAATVPLTDAAFGWRVSVRNVAVSVAEITVHVEWKRVWDNDAPSDGPSGASDLTLHPGDRVSLDRVLAPCALTGNVATLQVTFDAPSGGGRGGGMAGGIANVPGGGGRGGGMAGGVANVPGAAGGGGRGAPGTVPPQCAPDAPEPADGMRVFGSGGACLTIGSGFDPKTLEAVNVELWLVHTAPDGSQDTQYRKTITVSPGAKVLFDPISVVTSAGRVAVEIIGFVTAQRLPDGTENLGLSVARRGIGADGAVVSLGGTGQRIPFPKPGDVVSFDLPRNDRPDNFPPQDILSGHAFSIRVRVIR